MLIIIKSMANVLLPTSPLCRLTLHKCTIYFIFINIHMHIMHDKFAYIQHSSVQASHVSGGSSMTWASLPICTESLVGPLETARSPLFNYCLLCLSNSITQVLFDNNESLLLPFCLKPFHLSGVVWSPSNARFSFLNLTYCSSPAFLCQWHFIIVMQCST